MLECVVNISEGRSGPTLAALAERAGPYLLDLHRDTDHHRSVFTLAAPDPLVHELEEAVRALAAETVNLVDVRDHRGAHPHIGALDVVPFVSLTGWPVADGPLGPAVGARDRFAGWAGASLGLPCFLYGPERSLPDVRRAAWSSAQPDTGPLTPHPTAGAVAVGARPLLVAYNLWLATPDIDQARAVAARLRNQSRRRGDGVRALGLQVGSEVQVSCNLIAPAQVGPAAVFDAVSGRTAVSRAELVGLLPAAVLEATPGRRWAELDLDPSRTIEARLETAGLTPG